MKREQASSPMGRKLVTFVGEPSPAELNDELIPESVVFRSRNSSRFDVEEEEALLTEDGVVVSPDEVDIPDSMSKIITRHVFTINNLLFLLMIAIFVTNSVAFYKVSELAPSYPYILAQLSPFYNIITFGIIALITTMYRKFKSDPLSPHPLSVQDSESELLNPFQDLRPQQETFYQKYFLRQHFLFYCLQGFLYSFFLNLSRAGNAGDKIAPGVAILINQFGTPFTMCISFVFLRVRYSITHFIGAGLTMAGVIFTIYTDLSTAGESSIVSIILLIAVVPPTVIGGVLFDWYLKLPTSQDVNMFVMWCWIYGIQLLCGALILPAMLPITGTDLSDTVPHLRDGLKCVALGINSESSPEDDCEQVFWWFLFSFVMVMLLIVVITTVLKRVSAMMAQIAQAVAIPLSDVAFSFPLIMGKFAKGLTWRDGVALALVSCGIVLYRLVKEKRKVVRSVRVSDV